MKDNKKIFMFILVLFIMLQFDYIKTYANGVVTDQLEITECTEQKSGFDETEHGKVIDSGTCGEEKEDVNYKLYEDGMLYIYGNGLVKGETFNGYDEIGIHRNVYQYAKDIKTVYVEKEITAIGNYAFEHCENLKEVILPESIQNIGDYAFAYCYSLEKINLPVLLKEISSRMFFSCDSLSDVIIPNGVETIEEMAFACRGLQNVKLPSTLKKIGKDSFHLTYIEEIEIPENTELIEEGAFAYCNKLRKIKILGAETYIAKKAFESTNNFTIYCTENSEAEKFATENNISYKSLEEYDKIEISNTFNACKSSPCSISISCSENDEFTFLFADGKAVNSMYSGDIKSSLLGIVRYKKMYDLIFDKAGEYIVSVYKNGTIIENEKFIVAENHIYGNGVVSEEATCEKEGILKYTCENCGNYYTEKIPAIGHKYKETTIIEPTCEIRGVKLISCELCHSSKGEDIPATGHKYNAIIKRNATCEYYGEALYTCEYCNKEYMTKIPETGHNFSEWHLSKNATIFEYGEYKRECLNCGKEEIRKINKLQSKVKISKTKLSIKVGKKYKLKIKKKEVGDAVSKWVSSNKKVVTVDKKKGKISARKKGKATITLTMKSGCKAKCKVTVK